MFTLRFDMRAPAWGAAPAALYAAVPEMCAWAEDRGGLAAVFCEHHASEDGYLPSPFLPGPTLLPQRDDPSVVFVADDVERAWSELGDHLLRDARKYAEWNPGNQTSAGFSHVQTVDELRAVGASHVIISVPEAISRVRDGQIFNLAPLCGGLPPEIAWPYLKLVGDVVLPEALSDRKAATL